MQFAWSHKFLWPVGFFAAFLGQLGLVDLFSQTVASDRFFFSAPFAALFPARIQSGTIIAPEHLGVSGWTWLIMLLVMVIACGIVGIYLSVVSQGTLIHAAAASTTRKSLPPVGKSWHAGVRHFWRLLFLNVLRKGIFCVVALFIGWGTLNMLVEPSSWDMLLFFLIFILAALFGMVVSFYTMYAAGYVVVEEYVFINALRSAWRLFTAHWLVSLEVGLILLVLNLLLGVLAVVLMIILFIPVVLIWVFFALLGGTGGVLLGLGVTVALLFSVVLTVFAGSLFTIFNTAAWTYLFMKMHKEGVVSRLVHLVHGVK